MARSSVSNIARPAKPSSLVPKTMSSNGLTLAEERRLKALQKRLETEGYTGEFGVESIALTEKLLDDLVEIRKTHKTLMDQTQELRNNELRLQRQIQPLQKELSRIVRENNQLHLELIQKSEDLENLAKKSTLQEKKLSSEVTDKAFVIHQQFQQIRQLERDIGAHKARIEQLLDKNFTSTAGPTGDRMPKGQDIEISGALSIAAVRVADSRRVQVLSDLESETSTQISALKDQVASFAKIRQDLEFQVSSLTRAVENRESEILRMGKLLETSINSESEHLAHELQEKEDIIRRLTGQIDFLTSQVIDHDSHVRQRMGSNGTREKEVSKSRDAELVLRVQAAEKELATAKAKEQELCELLAASQQERVTLHETGTKRVNEEAVGKRVTSSFPDSREQFKIEQQLALYENQLISMEEACMKSKQLAAFYQEKLNAALAEVEGLKKQKSEGSDRDRTTLLIPESDILTNLRRKCDLLTEEKSSLISLLEESRQRCLVLQDDANEMRRLRDGLAAVVVDFENQLIMVQGNIHDLYSERDSKQLKIEELTDSLRRVEEELRKQVDSATLQSMTPQDVDKDRNNPVASEDDGKRTYENQGHDTAALSDRLQESNASVSVLQVKLETALAELRACSSRERTLSSQLKDAQGQCAEKESAIRQLQTLMTHLDETLGDVASRLQAYIEENAALADRSKALESEVQSLQVELKRRDDDVDRARSAISTVDGERDSLLLQLEERAEQILKLEASRADLEQRQSHSLTSFMTAQQQADLLRQALGDRDGQVRMLHDQLDAECKRRASLEAQLAVRIEEAQNLTSDLSIMTRENQVVNSELATLVSQREALKRDLDETFERLSVAEQLVQGREKERDDILMSYRALNEEKVRAEASLERCSSECHQLRAQVPFSSYLLRISLKRMARFRPQF